MRHVPGEGSKSARLVFIGEAPGKHEEASGRPFVGAAGMKATEWWGDVGLHRSDFYIDNVYQYRPQSNDIKNVPRDTLLEWVEDLHRRLAELYDPWLIVPTGNTALKALTGRGRWPWEIRNAPPGITAHRGSIYSYADSRGRTIKVIPTIHPAAIFRQATWEGRCRADWRRIASDATFRDLRVPERTHVTSPTFLDIEAFYNEAARCEALSIDIETPRERTLVKAPVRGKEKYKYVLGAPRITCVGFSYDPSYSLTIPLTESYWGSKEWLAEAWGWIRKLCALPCAKGGQNFLFDRWWLALPQYNCPVTNAYLDTRWMHHCLNPLDDHDLGYQASLDTREPYWKDDTKGGEELEGDPADWDTFLRYNGKDAAVTRELMDVRVAELQAAGKWETYCRLYASMYDPLLDTMLSGIRVNVKDQKRRYMRLIAECTAIQDRLTEIAGEKLYGKKDLSSVALKRYLHETLRIPKMLDRKTHRITVKEIAIRRMMLKYPERLGRDGESDKPGPLILTHRRKFKLASFIKEGVVDADGRSRCSYGFVDTLRLNSGKNPMRSGNNHQNQDRELLELFIPRPGHVFIEVDQSQAEDRVVKMLTESKRLIERARSMPWENDEHSRGAMVLFPQYRTWQEVPKGNGTTPATGLHRYLAKRCRHAGNYDMHGLKLSEELLKEGLTHTPEECEGYIKKIIDDDTPEVRDWQRAIRMLVIRDRCISNTWGYAVNFPYERMNDDLYRRAYAMIPQSEVATITNQWGWVPLHTLLTREALDAEVAWQKHDSLLLSTARPIAWKLAEFLRISFDRPRVYAGRKLTIPVELKLGSCGKAEFEWKRWPTREEFEEAMKTLPDRS